MPPRGGVTLTPGGGNAVGAGRARFLDDAAAGALWLGDTVEVLFHVDGPDGARLATRRTWVRDATATVRALAQLADGGEHESVPWRWAQLLREVDGRWVGLRVVLDWRDDSALVCEVEGPSRTRVRRELALLDERYGPHRHRSPLRVAGHGLLWAAAGGAVWLSAMRELQSTTTSHAMGVAMWVALTAGLGALAADVVIRAVPPRRAGTLPPGQFRAALGWAWVAVVTVFLLRPPWAPYVEWPPGWILAATAALAYGLASLPRGRSRAPVPPGPRPLTEVPGGVAAITALVRPAIPPETVVTTGDALAAYWRTHARLHPAEQRWNVADHAWEVPFGSVTAESYDAWEEGPVRVVLARAFDRALMVRATRDPLPLARDLTAAWFGAGAPVARETRRPSGGPAGWAVPLVLAWLCALTFAVGSDLGPSTYEWLWPVDFQVEHDYPLLAAACVLGVVAAYAYAVAGILALARTRGRRERRRAARVLAWQLVAVWLCAEVLTVTVAPRLAAQDWAATATAVVAVANLVALLVALGVVLGIRPDSPLGGVIDGPHGGH